MPWYYATNGERKGPVEEVEIRNLAREGVLQPDDLVWTESFGSSWQPARMVPGMEFAANPVPPPPTMPEMQFDQPLAASYKSTTHNRELMQAARETLRGRWGLAIGVPFLIGLIQLAVKLLGYIPLIGFVFSIAAWLIAGAFALGLTVFWLSLSRTGNGSLDQAFSGFQRFGTAFLAALLMVIFTLLWTLLLIVPGIIASYRYSQTWFVLADNPQMDALDAIRRSKLLMQGNKWKYFCLGWRFFGWLQLGILSLGIGMLWLAPYMRMSYAKFYDDLKPAA